MATERIQVGVVAAALSTDPRDTPRRAREAGFAGLQFDSTSGALDLTSLSGSGRREFRRLLSSQDQQLVGLREDVGVRGFGPGADVDRQLNRLDQVMEAAAGLAAPLVCVDLGPLPPAPARTPRANSMVSPLEAGLILLPEPAAAPAPPEPEPSPPDPAFVSQVNGGMAELGRRADRYGVVLAFRSELASFASLRQVLRDANCPWFGVDLDPIAVLRDSWDLDEVFSALGPLIHHVRGRDAVAGADRRTRPAVVGSGSVSWESLVSNLAETGYRGWITLDPVDLPERPTAAVAGLKHLHAIVQ
jgi:sugar phosphate isomerase/epimerase